MDRLTNKTIGTDFYTYNYIQQGNGLNLIQSVTGPSSASFTDYTYDGLNRVTQVNESTNGGLATKYNYDQYNNVSKITYPGGFAVNQSYNSTGYLNKITADNGNLIWQLNTVNPMQQITDYSLGNNTSNQNTYDNYGFAQNFSTLNSHNVYLHNMTFTFDQSNGNLLSRKDGAQSNSLKETFGYDNLNRLQTITNLNNTFMQTQTMQYSPNGNISEKPDIGTYSYNNPQQNQVLTISNPYGFVSSNSRIITYNSFKKASNIAITDINTGQPATQLNFLYGPEQQRRETDLINANGTNKTYYALNYDKQVSGNEVNEINYINTVGGVCAMFVKTPTDNGNMYYVHKDHLGSILALSDDQGNLFAKQSFDAWGQPRDNSSWTNFNAVNPSTNNTPGWLIRGFTGHEMLPDFSLINMNGRLYDPQLARMQSADDNVKDGNDAQDYNRYSYCKNNPTKYTDPSGKEFGEVDAAVLIVAIVVGGAANTLANADHISNFGEGALYFAVGGIGAGVGVIAGPAAGFLVGAGLNIVADYGTHFLNKNSDDLDILNSGIRGGTSALVGEEAGAKVTSSEMFTVREKILRESPEFTKKEVGELVRENWIKSGRFAENGFTDFITKDDNELNVALYHGALNALGNIKDQKNEGGALLSSFVGGFLGSYFSDRLIEDDDIYAKKSVFGKVFSSTLKSSINTVFSLYGTDASAAFTTHSQQWIINYWNSNNQALLNQGGGVYPDVITGLGYSLPLIISH